jgi:hypothetical protein
VLQENLVEDGRVPSKHVLRKLGLKSSGSGYTEILALVNSVTSLRVQ